MKVLKISLFMPTVLNITKIIFLISILFALPLLQSCGSTGEYEGKEIKAWIEEPSLSAYADGNTINFKGSGIDYYVDSKTHNWESYGIGGSDLIWSSSIDGILGIGEEFSRSDLALGEHKIILTAIGLNGNKAKASVKIMIREKEIE